MSEVVRIHSDDEVKSRIQRLASFVGSTTDTLVPTRREQLTFDQQRRLGRYVGSLALVAGNYYDDRTMQGAMDRVVDRLGNEGMLQPNRPVGIRVLWRSKNADAEGNQRLLYGSEVLRETLLEHGIAAHVSPRAEYPFGSKGSESRRALEALNRGAQGFESLLGYGGVRRDPDAGELALIAMIDSNWAGRAFRGVNIHQLRYDDGMVMLNGSGQYAEDFKWIAPSMRETLKQSHD